MVLAFAIQKGGTGKTSSTANIGFNLARKGFKVLLIDSDAQANLSQSFGVQSEKSIYHALIEGEDLPIVQVRENLHLVPAEIDLSALEVTLAPKAMKEQAPMQGYYRELLAPYKKEYDAILIDSPPQLGVTLSNIIAAADHILIPLDGEYFSMKGLTRLTQTIEALQKYYPTNIGGIFFNRHKKRLVVSQQIQESVRSTYGDLVFKSTIRETISVVEAGLNRQSVFEYEPKNPVCEDYEKLTKEIIDRFQLDTSPAKQYSWDVS